MADNISNVAPTPTGTEYYAYIRFFHALASDPPVNVDIYVNRRLIVSNLRYQDFTDYLTAYPGSYEIQIYETGNTTDQLLDIRVVLRANGIYTAAVVGTPSDVELELIGDNVRTNNTQYAYMRFANLSPNA